MLRKIYMGAGNTREEKLYAVFSYVRKRGLENIIGCSSGNVYEDFLELNPSIEISHETFSKMLYNEYRLKVKIIKDKGKSVRVLVHKD